ncbi:MAG: hypothetical protein ACRC3Y_12570 [Romboutsia sp.]|uniref:hypothetical protein n=1 Tax=Romboutsia sp. TaxID=1965302 RepID=UPI003F33AE63
MNKKLSKIILFTTIGTMLASSVCIGMNNKETYELVDINGNRDALGNVNIVYQESSGFYKTSEVIMSKDKTKVDKYAKGASSSFPLTSYYKEHRDLYKNYHVINANYEDENTIGFAEVERYYDRSDKLDTSIRVREKDLKTNKIKDYKIPVDYKVDQENGSFGNDSALKYNGEIYVLTTIDGEQIHPLGDSSNVYGTKESLINIYKLNLEDETSELVVSRKIGNKDELTNIYNSFKYENKFYMQKESYKKVGEDEYKKSYELISYDLKSKKFEFINIPETVNDYISSFYVDDDKVSLISYENKSTLDTKVHESNINETKDIKDKTNNSNDIEIKISKMDLKTNKFIGDNEKYTLKLPNDKFEYGIQEIRDIDDKLYIITNAYKDSDLFQNRGQLNKNEIYVIDKKTKKTVYSGSIKGESSSYIYSSIVTNDEL